MLKITHPKGLMKRRKRNKEQTGEAEHKKARW
jgi:hypothetical protein